MPSGLIAFLVLNALLGGCCILALVKGRAPERIGAVCLLLICLGEVAIKSFAGQGMVKFWLNLISTTLIAISFLVLALRYSKPWLGMAMIFQGALLSLLAMQWTGEILSKGLFFAVSYLLNLLVLVSLFCGTVGSWRTRLRERSAAPGRPDRGPSPVAA